MPPKVDPYATPVQRRIDALLIVIIAITVAILLLTGSHGRAAESQLKQVSIFSAGTQHPGYNQNTNQVAIDNLNVDFPTTLAAVPEPSTWLAAALALGVIGFSHRKRLRACARVINECMNRTVSNNR